MTRIYFIFIWLIFYSVLYNLIAMNYYSISLLNVYRLPGNDGLPGLPGLKGIKVR